MMGTLENYKNKFHFSVNFYSLFLIATFIPDVLHINALLIKYSFWFLKVLLACLIIMKDKRSLFNVTRLELLYMVLVVIYAAVIFIDVFVAPDQRLAKTENFYASGVIDFFGFCLGVIIAFSFRYDPGYESPSSASFFWITLTFALILAYFLSFESFDLDVSNGRYDANTTINSIMYGQTGCALALISILGFANNKKGILKVLFLLTFILGVVSIGKAGSRSPVIVLAIVSLFYFVARGGIYKSVLIVASVVTALIIFINQIITFLESIGSSLTVRLASMIYEKDTSGRDGLYQNAWNLIKESPFFGSFYVIRSGIGAGGYPHNFLLEVFMATGLFGGIPFIILLIVSIYRSFKLIKSKHQGSWIAVLYLQIVVYGMFSTGLYTSQDFWVLLFFIISMNRALVMKSNTVERSTITAR
jgi:O-antigen ligase